MHVRDRIDAFVFVIVAAFFVNVNAQQSEKVKIAVLPFSFNAASSTTVSEMDKADLASGLTDRLSVAIVGLERFEVVERLQLEKILSEQTLSQSGMVSDTSAVTIGKVSGAKTVVIGAVNGYSSAYKTTPAGKGYYEAQISLSVRFIDPSTAIIQKAVQIEKSEQGDSESSARFNAIGSAMGAVVEYIKQLYPIKAVVIAVEGQNVTINMGSEMGMRSGQYFRILCHGAEIVDQTTGKVLGKKTAVTAIVKIETVEKEYSIGKIKKKYGQITVGDEIEETRASTKLALSAGFASSTGSSGLNLPGEIIYTKYHDYYVQDFDTLTPDYSNYEKISQLRGFYLALELHQINYTNMMTGFFFAFMNQKSKFSAFDFDWRVAYEFPAIRDRLFIPLGAGIGLGRYHYSINYTQELQSQLSNYVVAVKESNASDDVSAFTYGAVAFSGLMVQLHKNVALNCQIGYRYHPVVTGWKGSYKVWEWNEENSDYEQVDKEFDIAQKWLPVKDVVLDGLDLRLGVSATF